ncbi:MAG: hypothetical protein ACRDOY_06085 [Nocardioidaceae bacterium]
MSDLDLNAVMHDDWLIDAIASGAALETDQTDPARAPLRALYDVVEGTPIPEYDGLDPLTLVDSGRQRRHAVRSLAIAVTAVGTLSTSGVAAVVSGDPLLPAKAVWNQIQGSTGEAHAPARSDGERAGSAAVTPPSSPARSSEDSATDAGRLAAGGTGTTVDGATVDVPSDASQADGLVPARPDGHSPADGRDAGGSESRSAERSAGAPGGRSDESGATSESADTTSAARSSGEAPSSEDQSSPEEQPSSEPSEPDPTPTDPSQPPEQWGSPAPWQHEPSLTTDKRLAPNIARGIALRAGADHSGTAAGRSTDASNDADQR